MDELRHECGIAAVYCFDPAAGSSAYTDSPDQIHKLIPRMLLDLQNRGQLAAGMATYNPRREKLLDTYKQIGTVIEAFRLNHQAKYESIMREYAGAAAICPELRDRFAGWERADSVVVNPHKWLGVPTDCSTLWTRRPEVFRDAFSLVPEYLRVSEEVASLSEYTQPLGRRFRALKLWAVLRCFGRTGLQERIREHVRLAELFESWIESEPGWEVVAPRPFSLVCFRREGSDEENERLLARVNASGEVFLSHTKLGGRYALRLAIGSYRTTEDDVRLAWDVLRREAVSG